MNKSEMKVGRTLKGVLPIGGGGNRTPVPMHFRQDHYVRSRSFDCRSPPRRSTSLMNPQPGEVSSATGPTAATDQPAK